MRLLLILLDCLQSLTVSTDISSTFVLPSSVEVTLVEAEFNVGKFKIEGCLEKNLTCRINDRMPYGAAFMLPKTYVKSLTVSFQGITYSLEVADMYNAWGGRPMAYSDSVRYFGGKCFDELNCQFRGLFSDAAGTFVAEWKIVDGYSFRTILTNTVDVVGLFMKNIDPPEFD